MTIDKATFRLIISAKFLERKNITLHIPQSSLRMQKLYHIKSHDQGQGQKVRLIQN